MERAARDGLNNAKLLASLVGVTPDQVDSIAELQAIGIPCFTPGALIETEDGQVPVEDIRPGDMVMTIDNGLQPVRWVGQRVESLAGDPPHDLSADVFGQAFQPHNHSMQRVHY